MGMIRPGQIDMGPVGSWVQVYEGSGFVPQDQQPYPKPYPCTPYPSEAYTNWDNISIKNNQMLLHILKTREQIQQNSQLLKLEFLTISHILESQFFELWMNFGDRQQHRALLLLPIWTKIKIQDAPCAENRFGTDSSNFNSIG